MKEPRSYYGGIPAVHQTPLLFRQGNHEQTAVHQCAGAGCVTCLWATHGVFRSYVGFWFGWNERLESVTIDDDRAACSILPEELNLL